ncbi:MAG: DinB family protein [Balneolales bacterium]|nr:DinB family protein [Balneolales bacterium]
MITIQSRKEIQHALEEAFTAVISFIASQPEELFQKSSAEGKWTTGQQLEHLIKSVTPINNAFLLPKLAIKMRFGSIDRNEMNYDELVDLYKQKLEEGAVASKPYIPEPVSLEQKNRLLQKYSIEKEHIIERLNKWSEKDLSSVAALHPVLGNLSIRELMFFTIYHNYHHLDSIKKIQ